MINPIRIVAGSLDEAITKAEISARYSNQTTNNKTTSIALFLIRIDIDLCIAQGMARAYTFDILERKQE